MVNWNYRIEPAVYVNMTQFYMILKFNLFSRACMPGKFTSSYLA